MADRTVQVKMNFDLGGEASRYMKDLAASTQEAKEAQERLKNALRGGVSGGSSGTGRGASGIVSNVGGFGAAGSSAAAEAGMSGALLTKLGAIGAGLATVGTAVTAATELGRISHDPFTTGEQGARQLFRSIVPFGERIQNLTDALSGRMAAMEAATLNTRNLMTDVGSRIQTSAMQLQVNPRAAELSGRAGAFAGQSAITLGAIDRQTVAGEREFREASRILPLKIAAQKAEREETAAAKERISTYAELGKLRQRELTLVSRRNDLERALPDSGPGRAAQLGRIQAVNKELEGNLDLQQRAQASARDATAKAVQATAERKKAEIARDFLGKAEILEERAAGKEATAITVGTMNRFERQFAARALEFTLAHRRDQVPEPLFQAAQQLAPDIVGKKVAGEFANDAITQRLNELRGLGTGTAEENRREAAEFRKVAGVQEFKVEAESATAIANSYKTLSKDIADIITRSNANLKNDILAEIRLSKTH